MAWEFVWTVIYGSMFLLFGSGLITTLISQKHTANKEIDSRLFQHKGTTYQEFLEFLNRRMQGDQNIDVEEKMSEFRELLTLWGDAQTINSFEFFAALNKNPGDEIDAFLRVDMLLRNLRRELGHNDKKLSIGTIALMQIKPDEEKDKLLEKIRQRSQTKEYEQRIKEFK